MDFFDLLILAALALPALFRWFGNQSKKKQTPTSAPPVDDRPEYVEAEESEFARAIREIGEALGGKEPESRPAERREYVPDEFGPKQEAATGSGFTREESFERAPSRSRTPAAAVPFKSLKLARIETPELEEVVPEKRATAAGGVVALLRARRSARDAVMLSEVLRPPLALRRQSPDERI